MDFVAPSKPGMEIGKTADGEIRMRLTSAEGFEMVLTMNENHRLWLIAELRKHGPEEVPRTETAATNERSTDK